MNSLENDFCKVSLHNSGRVATLFWKRDVKLDEFQVGCRQLATLFTGHNISRCLIECTNQRSLSAETQDWLSTLHANAALQVNHLQLALVMSEERYQNLIYDYSLSHTQSINLPIQLNYFTQIEDALDWLLREQALQA